MSDREPPGSLDDLEARLKAARADPFQPKDEELGANRARGMSAAFQVATELVAAMAVAVAIGWFLDDWLETQPLFLLIFFFLGAAAGTLNVYRRAQQMVGAIDQAGDGKEIERSAEPPEKEG